MSNNIYDIMAKLNSITTEPKQDETQEETVYENLEPRGSLIKAVKSLASKYEDFVAEENKQIDETQFSDKETFDKLAEPGDTYKTADGGTVTKTEKGIKHSAPSGKYGAGPEDDKDELDENTSENTLEESQADIRNHPIYTNEEAWDHYQKELAEANAEQEETVDIQDELNELNRLAGLAEKVGGNKSHDFVDDVTHKKDEVEEDSDPATYEKETYYEFTGDDGEQGSGYLYYTINVVDGKPVVDPKSLKATCNGDGNNKLTDEWCTQMVQPGGEEHQYALQAAQEEAEEEWNELDVPMDEEQLEEGPTRKDFQMVADLLKNIEDENKKVELANHHADTFAKQNPRFDKERFLSAVGLNEEQVAEACGGKYKKMSEDDVEEGNEFSGALAQAKKDGKKEFEVDGKTYKVEESMNEDINVSINASGEEDALKLMMKLAGVQAVAVQQEEAIEEERDIEYDNTPDEQVAPVSAAVPSGTDYHKSKKQDPATANKAANPLAEDEEENLEEGLWTAYQDMIAEVKKDENA